MLVTNYLYLHYNRATGKTELHSVHDHHHALNKAIDFTEISDFTSVKITGEELDIQFVVNKLFPDDDITLISQDEPAPDIREEDKFTGTTPVPE